MRRLLLFPAVLLTSCFEPVVEESLRIQFDDKGAAIVHVTTKMPARKLAEEHAASVRLRDLREAAVRGDDFWARQIEQLEPEHEQVTFEYSERVLVQAARSALLPDANRVEALFRSFGAGAFLTQRDDVLTFEIYPSRPARATDEQRKSARRTLESTSVAFAEYLRSARRLYEYLENKPDRAKDVFGALFETEHEASDDEVALAKTLRGTMDRVMTIFDLHETQPYTLDELSRLVFNPFPAQTSVEIQGVVEEVAGFASTSPARYEIPNIGLWGALKSLEGKWLSPDPLTAEFDLKAGEKKNPDAVVERFASETRTYSETPRPAEILNEIEQRLAPASVYRIRWRLPESSDRIAPR